MSTNETTTTARTQVTRAKPYGANGRPAGAAFRWLLWSPAIAIVLSAVAVPGGLVIFGLPLLALGYFVFALIARRGPYRWHEPAAQPARVHDHVRSR